VELRTSDIAEATGGSLVGPDVTVDGATIDSREIRGGELFVPVVAERDGHEFVAAALTAGAAAYLTSGRARPLRPPPGATAVEVGDTVVALTDIGRRARARLPDRVIGVTGSVGKTSVKDMLAASLAAGWRTAASRDSYNNELGVPLTLVNAPGSTEALVVEMGARAAGHIAHLAALARPTVGVVTRVASVHTEMFGGIDAVASAKGELVEALPPTGTAVLNAADPRVAAMASRTRARVVTFGEGGDVRAEGVEIDGGLRPAFRLVSPWGRAAVRLAARGTHMVDNALAAAAAALVCDVCLAHVADALARAELSHWRMALESLPSGAVVVNDAYNANPTSMAAALRSLVELPAKRHLAVLGVMAELGASSDDEHRAIGVLARELGVEVIGVGVAAYGGTTVEGLEAAADALGELNEGDAVLLKGSRVAGLERLLHLLA
jgi:UDP-N-acetylmuramoyl-tripeptide--D-alanyl-D-alanine ligase